MKGFDETSCTLLVIGGGKHFLLSKNILNPSSVALASRASCDMGTTLPPCSSLSGRLTEEVIAEKHAHGLVALCFRTCNFAELFF